MGGIVRLAHLLRGRAIRVITAFTILWWGFVIAPPARADDPVLVGAGDIADCSNHGAAITAGLLKSIPGTVFTVGDNAYKQGTPKQYKNCYGPTWGKFKARTKPAPGNHDFETKGAAGYFGYFGDAAG